MLTLFALCTCLSCDDRYSDCRDDHEKSCWCEQGKTAYCGPEGDWQSYQISFGVDCEKYGFSCIEWTDPNTGGDEVGCKVTDESCPKDFMTSEQGICKDNNAAACENGSEFPVVTFRSQICDRLNQTCHVSEKGEAFCIDTVTDDIRDN